MSMEFSYLGFVKEVTELVKATRTKGKIDPNLAVVFQRALESNAPSSMRSLNLRPLEVAFLAMLVVEGECCLDVTRRFSRALAASQEEVLILEYQIESSIIGGALGEFIQRTEHETLLVKAEVREALYKRLTNTSKWPGL